MATITLRVEDGIRDELERLARARDTSVSELLREAIADVLGTRRELVRQEVPRSIGMTDRRILALLHEILDKTDPQGKGDEHTRQIRALERGFTDEYAYEFGGFEPELPLTECSLAHDILEMFTVLEASLGKLGNQTVSTLGNNARHFLEFAGFDNNDSREARLLSYSQHLIETGRWESLAKHFDSEHENGNSHRPTLDYYQRMLVAYRSIVDRKQRAGRITLDSYQFNADELREVLAAAKDK